MASTFALTFPLRASEQLRVVVSDKSPAQLGGDRDALDSRVHAHHDLSDFWYGLINVKARVLLKDSDRYVDLKQLQVRRY